MRGKSTCRNCHASLVNALQLGTRVTCVVATAPIHDAMIRLVPSSKFHGVAILLFLCNFEKLHIFLLFLPLVLGSSPSSQWLRFRLVSICPLREVLGLGVPPFSSLCSNLFFSLQSIFPLRCNTHISCILRVTQTPLLSATVIRPMAQIHKCDAVTFLIGSTFWPKTRFVTPSHSLLGQRYGPKRDQKLFKNSNKIKKLYKNRKCDAVTFIIGSTLWPKS